MDWGGCLEPEEKEVGDGGGAGVGEGVEAAVSVI